MHTVRTTTKIDAPVATVWTVLSHLDSYGEWNPVIRRADGRLTVGSIVTIDVGPHAEQIDCRVTRVEPTAGFSWRFRGLHPLLYRGEHSFRLEAIDDGRTRLVDQESFAGILVPFRRRALDDRIKRSMRAMGAALKGRAEAGPDDDRTPQPTLD